MLAIRLDDVSKSYKSVIGLHPLSMQIERGELFGLIGPDGSGKTTLIRLISTLLKPDSGHIEILGQDAGKAYREIRTKIGYMPGNFSLYQDLTIRENLAFFASVFGVSFDEAVQRVSDIYSQLEPFADRKAGALSGGMKQKLALSCALVHHPELLLLDEPTTGVDAVSRREFWELLGRLHQNGMTIVVSTPYMDEANRCSRVALMQTGKILKMGAPSQIADDHEARLFAIKSASRFKTLNLLRNYPHVELVHAFGESLHYSDRRKEVSAEQIQRWLVDAGIEDAIVTKIQPGIEDVFIHLMTQASYAVTSN